MSERRFFENSLGVPDRSQKIRIGENLRHLREEHGKRLGRKYSQREVAKFLEVNEDTYRAHEYGQSEIPEERARRLASEWGVPYQKIVNPFGANQEPYSAGSDVSGPAIPIPKLVIPIPYIGNVGANSKADWLDPVETNEWIDVPNEMATPRGPHTVRFACTVIGDSCYDLLWPGDTAVFEKRNIPKLNHIMLFRSDDNTVTIKQIKHNGDGFILHPLNDSYKDEPALGTVVGFLVGIVRQMGSKKVTVYDAYGILP